MLKKLYTSFPFWIMVLAIGQYANTLQHDYTYDDAIVITQNSRVQKGIAGIPGLFQNIKSNKIEHRYGYRPVTLTTFAIEMSLFGMNPFWGHLVNVLLFALVGFLIYRWILDWFPAKGNWFAFGIAILFVVHPIHVEVVANIKSRDELLAMAFGLMFLMSLGNYLREGKIKAGIIAVGLLLLASLSKENGITFMAVGIGGMVAGVLPNSKTHIKRIFLPIAGAMGIVGLWVIIKLWLTEEIAFQETEAVGRTFGTIGNPLSEVKSTSHILANSFSLLGRYTLHGLAGYPLLHDYSRDVISVTSWADWKVWLSLIGHAGLLGIALWHRKKMPAFTMGVLFYLLTISIFLQFPIKGPDIYAERLLFIPSLGLYLAMGGLIAQAVSHPKMEKVPQTVLWVVFAGLLVFMSIRTIDRNGDWANNWKLLQADLPKAPSCARIHYNLATEYERKVENRGGEWTAAERTQYQYHLKKSIEITPLSFQSFILLGQSYMEDNALPQARQIFVDFHGEYPETQISTFLLGKFYVTVNEFRKAIPLLEQVYQATDFGAEGYFLYGYSLVKTQKIKEGVEVFRNGKEKFSFPADYLYVCGQLIYLFESQTEGLSWVREALALEPQNPVYIQAVQEMTGNLGQP